MAMINSFLAALGAALAGFVGHLAAHDFVEFAPKLSKALIRHAAAILPEDSRERYEEEWLAHLGECTGVFSKLRHAFGCILCGRRMRTQNSQSELSNTIIRFEIDGAGTIELNYASCAFFLEAVQYGTVVQKYPWLRLRFLVRLNYKVRRFRLRNYGQADGHKVLALLRMLERCPSGFSGMKVWINGKSIDSEQPQQTPPQ